MLTEDWLEFCAGHIWQAQSGIDPEQEQLAAIVLS